MYTWVKQWVRNPGRRVPLLVCHSLSIAVSIAVGLTCSWLSCLSLHAPSTRHLTQGIVRKKVWWKVRVLIESLTKGVEHRVLNLLSLWLFISFSLGVNVQNPCFQLLKPLELNGPDTTQAQHFSPGQQTSLTHSHSTHAHMLLHPLHTFCIELEWKTFRLTQDLLHLIVKNGK